VPHFSGLVRNSDLVFTHASTGAESDNSRTFHSRALLRTTGLSSSPCACERRHLRPRCRRPLLGTKFIVCRPRGSFTLHGDITWPAVFLAGGIGIAPIRSIQAGQPETSASASRFELRTWFDSPLSAPPEYYYWVDNVISQLSGVPGVRKIPFDSRIRYRGMGPRSPLPKESSPVA
jgi:hypothetical protein